MPSIALVALVAIVAVAYAAALGVALLRHRVPAAVVLPFAPIVGWAAHGVTSVLLFYALPFSRASVVAVAAALLAVAIATSRRRNRAYERAERETAARVPAAAYVLAALVAIASAAAILPKFGDHGPRLSDPIFDHAKVSLVDDLAAHGLPPGNPYIGGAASGRLAYYYLGHFEAAQIARAIGATGWEADTAMTFFAAFASLGVAMGVALRLSGRSGAAVIAVFCAAASSGRFVLETLFGKDAVESFVSTPGGFAGWFFQSAWVPQHTASSACAIVAIWLVTLLPARIDAARIGATAVLMAAGFESSTWIGGVTLAVAMVLVVPVTVMKTERGRRLPVLAATIAAGVVALALATPFVHDQLASAASRQAAAPIVFRPFPVLDTRMSSGVRAAWDVPAYWLLLLPIEFVAVYGAGLAAMRRFGRSVEGAGLGALAIAALAVGGSLASTLADNNDLAWRAGLLASATLVGLAAAGIATWLAERRIVASVAAIVAIAIGLADGVRLAEGNLSGVDRPGAAAFAQAPALWSTVRSVTSPDERVMNDPRSLAAFTPWPVNIGWSLLAARRSCYATWELTQVYTPIPHDRLREIDDRFIAAFAGDARPSDVDALAATWDCAVAVVTPEDGAWLRDPFRASTAWRLVDERPDAWRIYRRVATNGDSGRVTTSN